MNLLIRSEKAPTLAQPCLEAKLGSTCLITGVAQDGIMIPIPQYPLYSATMTLLGGTSVGYYLNEENGWSMDIPELERAYAEAEVQTRGPRPSWPCMAVEAKGIHVRAIAIINPGNPTGQILSEAPSLAYLLISSGAKCGALTLIG
jgi:aspartate/methionine/tyrosine aminotransferase